MWDNPPPSPFPLSHLTPQSLHRSCALPRAPGGPSFKECPGVAGRTGTFPEPPRKGTPRPRISKPHAPFARLPQQIARILHPRPREHPKSAGIYADNTTSCALYLTHPTEGGTFTTAPPQIESRKKYRSTLRSGPPHASPALQTSQPSPAHPRCPDAQADPNAHVASNKCTAQFSGTMPISSWYLRPDRPPHPFHRTI